LKLNGLHGVISQKIILFITTAVETSNPTFLLVVYLHGNAYYLFFFKATAEKRQRRLLLLNLKKKAKTKTGNIYKRNSSRLIWKSLSTLSCRFEASGDMIPGTLTSALMNSE
jgi:hypothetical protein